MQITIRIAGDEYTLTRDDILRAAKSAHPNRIDTFYVEISGTFLSKFPPAAPNPKVTPKENFRFIGVVFDELLQHLRLRRKLLAAFVAFIDLGEHEIDDVMLFLRLVPG